MCTGRGCKTGVGKELISGDRLAWRVKESVLGESSTKEDGVGEGGALTLTKGLVRCLGTSLGSGTL